MKALTKVPPGLEPLIELCLPQLRAVSWLGVPSRVTGVVQTAQRDAGIAGAATWLINRFITKRKETPKGPLAVAMTIWETSTPALREAFYLHAWRRANPTWARSKEHDPFPTME